jgi:hypothetical protein
MVFYEEQPAPSAGTVTAAALKKQTIVEFLNRNQSRLESMKQSISEVIDENRDLVRKLEEIL